jgi:FixJ family two-component response regulator
VEVRIKHLESSFHGLPNLSQSFSFIFLTAHGDIPMTVKAMKSGAVEFLTKAFRPQALLDAIQQALQRDPLSRRQRNDMAKELTLEQVNRNGGVVQLDHGLPLRELALWIV